MVNFVDRFAQLKTLKSTKDSALAGDLSECLQMS